MPDDYSADITTTGRAVIGGAVHGVIEVAGDSDWFAADLLGGQYYQITFFGHTSRNSVRDVYDRTGTLLTPDILLLSTNHSEQILSVGADGTYFLAAGGVGTFAQAYNIQVTPLSSRSGTDGDDTIAGTRAYDVLNGGAGHDTLTFADAREGVTISGYRDAMRFSVGSDRPVTLLGFEAVTGSSFNDYFFGTQGDDVYRGLGGHDTFYGSAGADRLDGGAGQDRVDFYAASTGVAVSLLAGTGTGGTAAGDTYRAIENLTGSNHGDSLSGDHQSNQIDGYYGNDTLTGHGGDDVIYGGVGTDTAVFSGNRADYLLVRTDFRIAATHLAGAGADGTDTLGHIEILRFADGDVMYDTLPQVGTDRAEYFTGTAGPDSIDARGGDDTITGSGGADRIDGGTGRDTMRYSGAAGVSVLLLEGRGIAGDAAGDSYTGIENLEGSQGADTLAGDDAENVLLGNSGDDILTGHGGDDLIYGGWLHDYGGTDTDTAVFSGHRADYTIIHTSYLIEVTGPEGRDTLHSIDVLQFADGSVNVTDLPWVGTGGGDGFHDTTTGADRYRGLGGPDEFSGSAGPDYYDGGAGFDTIYFGNSASGVTASLLRGRGWTGDAAGDRYTGIEWLYGSSHNDMLTGDHRLNRLNGGFGNDTLVGAGGDDLVYGEVGTDTAIFSGNRDDYTIRQNGARATVSHLDGAGGDGTDTLLSIEILRFADGDFLL